MPDRTRLQRLLVTHQDWYERFLADPSFFLVIDSYPIELLFPLRQGRSTQQVGKKSKDKGRWSIGIKLCWVLNRFGQVMDWDWDTRNIPDKEFQPLIQQFSGRSIVLADQARLASAVALFNVLLTLFHQLHPDTDPFQMSIAEFSL